MSCVLWVCKSSCKLKLTCREYIICYKSLPKHETVIEDLDNQNRYTALPSMNAQSRSWFISARVALVKFPLCCSCLALLVCFTFAQQNIYLRIRNKNRYCLQNKIYLSMKIKLLHMRVDICKICYLALCLRSVPGNKVHQTLLMDDFFKIYLSQSKYELQISFTLR